MNNFKVGDIVTIKKTSNCNCEICKRLKKTHAIVIDVCDSAVYVKINEKWDKEAYYFEDLELVPKVAKTKVIGKQV